MVILGGWVFLMSEIPLSGEADNLCLTDRYRPYPLQRFGSSVGQHILLDSISFWMCKVRCWRWLFGSKIRISLG